APHSSLLPYTTLFRSREDAPDIVDETHVEHPVALIQHQDLHLAQVDRLLLHMVKQPARRSDQDVHAAAQRIDLRLHADTAVNQRSEEHTSELQSPDHL